MQVYSGFYVSHTTSGIRFINVKIGHFQTFLPRTEGQVRYERHFNVFAVNGMYATCRQILQGNREGFPILKVSDDGV
jgi:hypothetical protein